MPANLTVKQQFRNLLLTLFIICVIQLVCAFLPPDLGRRLGLGTCIFGGLLTFLQICVLCLLVRQNLVGRDKHA